MLMICLPELADALSHQPHIDVNWDMGKESPEAPHVTIPL